jgi:c-di-GMP-binding flagellar brake protein YcgR
LDARFRVLRYPVISLQVFGKVVRVQPTEKAGTKSYEIALEFVDLDKDIKEWIISYVFQKQRETIRSEKRRGHG